MMKKDEGILLSAIDLAS